MSESFNPHRSLRTGATRIPGLKVEVDSFQSSPVTEDRCNGRPNVTANLAPGFQSSPVTEDRCNDHVYVRECYHRRFQSSPVTEDRCNLAEVERIQARDKVSILTGH